MVAGVAAGIGRYADTDPVIIRIGFVVLAFFNGIGLLVDRLPWFHWPYWAHFGTLWPLVLVFIGAGLILRARRSASTTGGTS